MGSNNSTNIEHISCDDGKQSDKKIRQTKNAKKRTQGDNTNYDTVEQQSKSHATTEDAVTPFKTEVDVKSIKSTEPAETQNENDRQFSELEQQNLELQDYIENLESQLEAIDRENESKRGSSNNFSESLKVKDQAIQKLEQENETLKGELSKLRIKFKKKIRILNTKLTEEKNETSVRALELKEEMEALRERNAMLEGQLKEGNNHPTVAGDSFSNEEPGSHTNVILELSSRVSEQDDRIVQLQNMLNEKDKQIERLQKSMKKTPVPKPKSIYNKDKEEHSYAEDKWADEQQPLKDDPLLRSQSNFEGSSEWYGTKTFEQIARQNTSNSLTTPQSSSRSFPGRDVPPKRTETDKTKSELAAIAEEMKQLRKKKTRSKRREVERPASGRDSGLSIESNSRLTNSAPHTGHRSRVGSGVSHTSSVLSADSPTNEGDLDGTKHRKQSNEANVSLHRPPSGSVKYDADISHCDTDLALSDSSEKDNDTRDTENTAGNATPVDRSSIRQISVPKTKKRKGLLKTLARKDSLENGDRDGLSGGADQRPPRPYKVKPRDGDVSDADMLINSIDDELLRHNKSAANSLPLTAVS